MVRSVDAFNLSYQVSEENLPSYRCIVTFAGNCGYSLNYTKILKVICSVESKHCNDFLCLLHSNLLRCLVFCLDRQVHNISIGCLGNIDYLRYVDLWDVGMSHCKFKNYLYLQECYLKKSLSMVLGICQVHSVAIKFSKILVVAWNHLSLAKNTVSLSLKY